MAGPRYAHTATLLTNGKVLVAGGVSTGSSPTASAELYDPATGAWTATGSMTTARYVHTATLLPNGKVLVAGGSNSSSFSPLSGLSATGPLTSAELYDPATGSWALTGSLATARYLHTATLLQNGKVLAVGGTNTVGGISSTDLASAELYDPATGLWTATGSMTAAHTSGTTTQLPNGQVLVAGGYTGSIYTASAELYNPATSTWTVTGSMPTARYAGTATMLPNGQVLAAGGKTSRSSLASAELYDPAAGAWTPLVGSMTSPRAGHTATLLPNGQVLAAGGSASGTFYVASAELYWNPGDTSAPTASPTQSPAANGAGWNNTDVTVTWNWTANSGGVGIDPANCTTTNSTVSLGEGSLTLNATCTDLAGNTGTASYTVKIDKTPPTITANAVRTDSTAYIAGTWTNQTVTVSFACGDALSGVPLCPDRKSVV